MGEPHSEDHSHIRMITESHSPSIIHNLTAGSSLVALDTSRYSGFSPTALRHSLSLPGQPRSRSVSVSGDPTSGDVDVAKPAKTDIFDTIKLNPLPNKTINFDPRSVNLLLALRVQEVLACAEPMWDWVVDFQETVSRASATMSPRLTFDGITFQAPRRRRHPKEDALMSLTRLQFDEHLRCFELCVMIFFTFLTGRWASWRRYRIDGRGHQEASVSKELSVARMQS